MFSGFWKCFLNQEFTLVKTIGKKVCLTQTNKAALFCLKGVCHFIGGFMENEWKKKIEETYFFELNKNGFKGVEKTTTVLLQRCKLVANEIELSGKNLEKIAEIQRFYFNVLHALEITRENNKSPYLKDIIEEILLVEIFENSFYFNEIYLYGSDNILIN